MGKTILIRVDEELVETLENIRKEIAIKVKEELDIDDLEITGTSVSKILAQRLNQNIKTFNIKVKKVRKTSNYGLLFLGE